MNDFDRFLETQLRRMLDPVVAVATRPPARGRRQRAPELVLAVGPPKLVLAVVEAVPVTIAAAPVPQN